MHLQNKNNKAYPSELHKVFSFGGSFNMWISETKIWLTGGGS